jgi:hypothetical protein
MAISNVTPPANNPDFATAAAAAGFRVWDQNGQWVTDGVQATVQAFLDADAPLARNKAKAIAALQAEFTRRLNLLTDSAQYTVSMTIIARILDLTQRGTAVPAGLAALRNAASSNLDDVLTLAGKYRAALATINALTDARQAHSFDVTAAALWA